MQLSDEQQRIFDKYIKGDNIFLTGPGGVGKSALIKEIYNDAIKNMKQIQVCGLTGCASVLLECKAKTVHSWAGIGRAVGESNKIIDRVIKNKYKKRNWLDTDILIVDEVSMMSKKLFNILNTIGQRVKKNKKMYGGIQVIFSGDFYQLPPVGDEDDIESTQFCFESDDWYSVFNIENQIHLKKIFRQEDPIYANILNQVREGKLKRKSYEKLMEQVDKKIQINEDILPTKLYPRRYSVERINNDEMNKLNTPEKIFDRKRESKLSPDDKNNLYSSEEVEYEFLYLESSVPCKKTINLRVGAQVMCIVNMDVSCGYTLCNGSQGTIINFTEDNLPVIKFHGIPRPITIGIHTWISEAIPKLGISQIPLILAWALTIHKAQGATISLAEIDAGKNIFECGQTYVALSRVKSLEGLYLYDFDYKKILVNKKVQEYYSNLELLKKNQKNETSDISKTTAETTPEDKSDMTINKGSILLMKNWLSQS